MFLHFIRNFKKKRSFILFFKFYRVSSSCLRGGTKKKKREKIGLGCSATVCFTHLALGGDARDRAQVTLERGGCARCGTGNGEKARDRRDGEKKRLHPRGIQRFIDWHGGGARLKAAIIIIIIISPRVE